MKMIVISDAHYQHICDQFGARLKEAREGLGWTQQEFADNIGYKGSSSISNWEKGGGLPRIRTLYHLAKWMGWSIDHMFGFSNERYHAQGMARKKAQHGRSAS